MPILPCLFRALRNRPGIALDTTGWFDKRLSLGYLVCHHLLMHVLLVSRCTISYTWPNQLQSPSGQGPAMLYAYCHDNLRLTPS